MQRRAGERTDVGRRRRRVGVLAVFVALATGGTSAACTQARPSATASRSGSPSASMSSSASGSAPSAPSGTAGFPGALAEPRMQPATQASIGDPLFPGLGNGGYDVQRYDLRLTYPRKDPDQTIGGSVTITARATRDLRSLDLDAGPRSGITGVTVDGRSAGFSLRGQELAISLPSALARGRRFSIGVRHFTATPAPSNAGSIGVASFLSTRDGTAVAGQPNTTHLFFPCNDHPSDKAVFDIHRRRAGGLDGRRQR